VVPIAQKLPGGAAAPPYRNPVEFISVRSPGVVRLASANAGLIDLIFSG
jgi:hypothetical protein